MPASRTPLGVLIRGTELGPDDDQSQSVIMELIPGVEGAPLFDPENPAVATCVEDRVRIGDESTSVGTRPVFAFSQMPALFDAIGYAREDSAAGLWRVSDTDAESKDEPQRVEDLEDGEQHRLVSDTGKAVLYTEVAEQAMAAIVEDFGVVIP